MGRQLGLMSMKEAARLAVMDQLLAGELDQAQATLKLGLSVRQIKRLNQRVREDGAEGLLSKRRGMPSNRRVADAVREQVVSLVREHYADFGPEMHRPWMGTVAQLAAVCAVHHQRQLSAQLACRFQGQVLQLDAGQVHAPKASAMVDIAQYANGEVTLSYRGHTLKHKRFACQDHVILSPAL